MWPHWWVFSCLLCLTASVYTSNMDFNSTAPEFIANLTPSLTFTCVFTGKSLSGNGLVGRDVTQAGNDIAFLTSLVITRNDKKRGNHVASILEHFPAKALVDQKNLNVTGQLSGATGQLTLTWQWPADQQAAEYTCEGNGMSSLGHPVQVSKSLEVVLKTPDALDLVQFIHDQRESISALKQNFDVLTKQNLDQAGKIQDLTKQNQDQEAKIQTQMTQNNNQDIDISELRHVESGVIDCDDDHNWPYSGKMTDGYNTIYRNMRGSFRHSYRKAPVVHLSLEHMDSKTKDKDVYWYLELVSVDTTGFTLRCRTIANRIYGMEVRWISIPQ